MSEPAKLTEEEIEKLLKRTRTKSSLMSLEEVIALNRKITERWEREKRLFTEGKGML